MNSDLSLYAHDALSTNGGNGFLDAKAFTTSQSEFWLDSARFPRILLNHTVSLSRFVVAFSIREVIFFIATVLQLLTASAAKVSQRHHEVRSFENVLHDRSFFGRGSSEAGRDICRLWHPQTSLRSSLTSLTSTALTSLAFGIDLCVISKNNPLQQMPDFERTSRLLLRSGRTILERRLQFHDCRRGRGLTNFCTKIQERKFAAEKVWVRTNAGEDGEVETGACACTRRTKITNKVFERATMLNADEYIREVTKSAERRHKECWHDLGRKV